MHLSIGILGIAGGGKKTKLDAAQKRHPCGAISCAGYAPPFGGALYVWAGGAALTFAVLTLAMLALAVLTFAVLTLAALTLAVLTLAVLTLAVPTLATLTLAVLTLATLTLAVLTLATLTLAVLTFAVLTLAVLTLAVLTLAVLTLAALTLAVRLVTRPYSSLVSPYNSPQATQRTQCDERHAAHRNRPTDAMGAPPPGHLGSGG